MTIGRSNKKFICNQEHLFDRTSVGPVVGICYAQKGRSYKKDKTDDTWDVAGFWLIKSSGWCCTWLPTAFCAMESLKWVLTHCFNLLYLCLFILFMFICLVWSNKICGVHYSCIYFWLPRCKHGQNSRLRFFLCFQYSFLYSACIKTERNIVSLL